jgi:hypothetical protein
LKAIKQLDKRPQIYLTKAGKASLSMPEENLGAVMPLAFEFLGRVE